MSAVLTDAERVVALEAKCALLAVSLKQAEEAIERENGGPAFPIPENCDWDGMALRDYFAAQALTTCLGYEKDDIKCWEPVDFARHAYQVADAMLTERAK